MPRRLAAVLLVALAVLVLARDGAGFSGGRSDRAARGCGDAECHGLLPAPTRPLLEGVPEEYVPGETYLLNVSVEGARDPIPVATAAGGFALGASDGALSAVPEDNRVQIAEDRNATHTRAGSLRRGWTVVWTAPPETAGEVTFHVAVNAVNGNAAPDPLDEWNVATFASKEGRVPPPPETPRSGIPGSPQTPTSEGGGVPAPGLLVALAALAAAVAWRRGARRA